MKNLFFAILSLCFISNGISQTAQEKERVRKDLATGMVSFVQSTRHVYKKGQSYQEFQRALCGTKIPTQSGLALLKKSHEFLSKGTSDAEIQNTYDGQEIGVAMFALNDIKIKNKNATGAELFGGTTGDFNPYTDNSKRCKWYQIGCHLTNLLNWISENHTNISVAVQTIGVIFPGIFVLP